MATIDNAEYPIECPNCGHEISETVAWYKANPNFTCPNCDFLFEAEDFARGLKEFCDEWNKMVDSLDKLGDTMKDL